MWDQYTEKEMQFWFILNDVSVHVNPMTTKAIHLSVETKTTECISYSLVIVYYLLTIRYDCCRCIELFIVFTFLFYMIHLVNLVFIDHIQREKA